MLSIELYKFFICQQNELTLDLVDKLTFAYRRQLSVSIYCDLQDDSRRHWLEHLEYQTD